MRVYDLIWKKREGGELTREELEFLISRFVNGEIPDYQMSAWCMAVFFKGMTFEECTALTLAMIDSGQKIDLSSIPGLKVDKHSTGGVGDKTSLVLLPLVAAAGGTVAKMSGRGLGHTGGTIDKLESIPGFRTDLSQNEFIKQVSQIGIAIMGQTKALVPADKKLYALRDLTATVESIPLIASSIVSKKLAAGTDAIVLDVKYGDGAFMHDFENALDLARTMVEIGNRAGRRFKAVLSDMNQPLGLAIGNSLEIAEAITTLKGEGPPDLTKLCLTLGGLMLFLAGLSDTPESGEEMLSEKLSSGAAFAKFKELIEAQGGNPKVGDDLNLLPKAPVIRKIMAPCDGWIERINCRTLGIIAMELGAGRNRLEDIIKPEVGLRLHAKVGDYLKKGALLAEVHALKDSDAEMASLQLVDCFHFTLEPVDRPALVKVII
ncbi:MAG: pyrimidine-nucleoside phosphorylase [Firmicutes bacterium]|nr:pyrimidine-nucleoside phosphorylase [Bacillota bacterium]